MYYDILYHFLLDVVTFLMYSINKRKMAIKYGISTGEYIV